MKFWSYRCIQLLISRNNVLALVGRHLLVTIGTGDPS